MFTCIKFAGKLVYVYEWSWMIISQDGRRIDEVVGNARQTRTGDPRTPGDFGHQQEASTRNTSDHKNKGEYLSSNNSKRNNYLFYRIILYTRDWTPIWTQRISKAHYNDKKNKYKCS
jgi:hypothetical protein